MPLARCSIVLMDAESANARCMLHLLCFPDVNNLQTEKVLQETDGTLSMHPSSPRVRFSRPYRTEANDRARPRPRLSPAPAEAGTSSTRIEDSINVQSSNGRLKLTTNAYSLYKLSQAKNVTVFEYELKVVLSNDCKNFHQGVLKKPSVTTGVRQIIFNDIIPQLNEQNPALGSVIIDNNMESIFSLTAFNHSESHKPSSSQESMFYKNMLVMSDLIHRVKVDISIAYKKSHPSNSSELSFLLSTAILHNRPSLQMIKYGSVYYLLRQHSQVDLAGPRIDLISDHITGVSLSGTRYNERGQSLVVINCSHCFVTQAHRLVDILASYLTGKPITVDDLRRSSSDRQVILALRSVTGDESWFPEFCHFLEGFKCKAQVSGSSVNLRFSLTNISISREASGINIDQERVDLDYPNLPRLISPHPQHPLIPFESCILIPGQKVPIFRLSTNARNHLNFMNKPKPQPYKDSSHNAKLTVEAMNKSELDSFGFRLSDKPIETTGLILQKPRLQYNDKDFMPARDYWESSLFYQSVELVGNWCVVNTVNVDQRVERNFFLDFSSYSTRFGIRMNQPIVLEQPKVTLTDFNAVDDLVSRCLSLTGGKLRFLMFIIDSSSTELNRVIHLSFDKYTNITATCLRVDSIMKQRQHRAIFRTLLHKMNARLGGANVTYSAKALGEINLRAEELMIVGLDVTHPDNELSGVSIVGCAYTYSRDLFKHRSLVWPQTARREIIDKLSKLLRTILEEFRVENKGGMPKHIIIYRDGVSHEEFDKVESIEIADALEEINSYCEDTRQLRPKLSYVVAQKRHTMRFFHVNHNNLASNPPGGTLINEEVISRVGREFYLYSNTSPLATARPIHYHVLTKGLDMDVLQKLTYFLCFNFGKCSGSLSMPSSLRYAHNAAYDARNRVITAREFSKNKFYANKFFC